MTKYIAPLVGMKFHAPAPAILQVLPSGAAIQLVPEPENPFDPNAIVVRVRADAVPQEKHEVLALVLQGYGYSLDDFMGPVPDADGQPSWPYWQLGHVKANNAQDASRSSAAEMAPLLAGRTMIAELQFDMEGRPLVVFEIPVGEATS